MIAGVKPHASSNVLFEEARLGLMQKWDIKIFLFKGTHKSLWIAPMVFIPFLESLDGSLAIYCYPCMYSMPADSINHLITIQKHNNRLNKINNAQVKEITRNPPFPINQSVKK